MQQIDRRELRAPALVLELDRQTIAEGPPTMISVARYNSLWCLVRNGAHPPFIRFWDVRDDECISEASILSEQCHAVGTDPVAPGVLGPEEPPVEITVVICTRDRAQQLKRTLGSLALQSDRQFDVIVLDNAPSGEETAKVVAENGLLRCSYHLEPRPGLSHARNTGLRLVQTEFVAWIDDDEIADQEWIAQIKKGFRHPSNPSAVCGVMLPAELESEAQIRFEQYGGFNKGRGLAPEVLEIGAPGVPDPLYPLPAVGSGGNMAFATAELRAIGGFDPCLGAGTRTHGGEETRVFAMLLRAGHRVLHWPGAITWHFHRREMDELRDQFFGYSAGLSAFYASVLLSNPRMITELIRLGPHALKDLGVVGGGIRSDEVPSDFPPELLAAARRGLLKGGFLYVAEFLRTRLASTGGSTGAQLPRGVHPADRRR